MTRPIAFEDIKPGDRILTVTKDRDLLEYAVFTAHKYVRQDLLSPIEHWETETGVVGVSRYVDNTNFFDTQIFIIPAALASIEETV